MTDREVFNSKIKIERSETNDKLEEMTKKIEKQNEIIEELEQQNSYLREENDNNKTPSNF